MANKTLQYSVDIPSALTALGGGTFFEAGHAAFFSGRSSAFDGKGGILFFDETSTETANGKTIFKPSDLADEDAGRWKLLQELNEPAGIIKMFGGASAPFGYLLCDGAAISRTTYDDLFTAIGTTYGVGDGSTTFNLPNFTQRFPLGKSSSGTGQNLGDSGGNIDHAHGSPITSSAPSAILNNVSLLALGSAATDNHTHQVTLTPQNPPFLVVNFIIKT